MSHASITRARSGCGCGCGGSSGKGGGCSCGGKAGLCEGQDIARPRFFAGQLLTEDDLDLLTTYVVEKNRLHNRSFFGQGVVCGLEVTCDPCGGAKVTVQSGYALDCCGNDVVVHCPQTLDINAMVRQLRIEKTGGIDCGDPCTESKAKAAAPKPARAAALAATDRMAAMSMVPGAAKDDQQAEIPPLPGAEYCLYVRYCERLTDPVSPYATNDPCGAQACEPTRVHEGFTFELRCRDCDEPVPDNLFSRLKACLDNLESAEHTVRNIRSLTLYDRHLADSLRRIQTEKPAQRFEPERLEVVKAARQQVEELPAVPDDWTAAHAFDAAEAGQTLASHVAAWQSLTKQEQDDLANAAQVKQSVKEAEEGLGILETKTPHDKLAKLIESPLDRDIVTVTLQRAVLWKVGATAKVNVPDGEVRILGGGAVFARGMHLSSALARIKATMINWLTARGPLTDCTLLQDLRAIVLPEEPTDAELEGNAVITSDATQRLERALWRYLRECGCSAINPPCLPCEDPAVLLACLRVEECQVVDICNLERTFVLTAVAMRYWMPFLGVFGDLIERACCPNDECDPGLKKPSLVPTTVKRRPNLNLTRATIERRSALDTATRFVAPGMMLDPDSVAAMLPRKLSFSPENARRLAFSAAGLLDLASLRRGTTVRDVLSPVTRAPMAVAAGAAAPAGPTPEETAANVATLRAQVEELTKKHAAAERRLDTRLKKLEGP